MGENNNGEVQPEADGLIEKPQEIKLSKYLEKGEK
jgi:hypothetical protein